MLTLKYIVGGLSNFSITQMTDLISHCQCDKCIYSLFSDWGKKPQWALLDWILFMLAL